MQFKSYNQTESLSLPCLLTYSSNNIMADFNIALLIVYCVHTATATNFFYIPMHKKIVPAAFAMQQGTNKYTILAVPPYLSLYD